MITKKYYKLIRVSHADEGYFYIKNVSNEIGEFKINNYTSGTMEYSLDGVTWTSYDLTNKPGVNVNPGSNIYLRGTNFKYSATSNTNVFSFNKDYNICGNFMSLSNYTTMSSITQITSSNEIRCAFYNQTHLISTEDLNFGGVTSIGENCFKSVFRGCSSLITCPDLSNVTSIGKTCFLTTFSGCTSLTTGIDFSNVTSAGQYALSSIYAGCTHISNVTTPNVQDLTQNIVLDSWLAESAGSQVTGTKVVRVPTGATISTNSNSGIPTGWTRVDY